MGETFSKLLASLRSTPSLENLRGKLLFSLVLALVVIVALAFYADLPKLLEALARFPWLFLLAVYALTMVNYLCRFVKWNYLLGQIGVRSLKWRESFLLFFSAFSMTLTPGKVGEFMKSYLLRELTGTPFTRSAPIIVVERLSDGIAMLLLASLGLLVFQVAWQVLQAALVVFVAIVFLAQYRPLALRILALGERLPVVALFSHHLRAFYESAYVLLSLRNLLVTVSLGTVAWFAECVAFFLVLVGVGGEPTPLLLLQAVFILAVAQLASALLLVPGGLGIAEGGITGLTQLLLGMSRDAAVAGALIIRLGTLWFGVSLGLTAFWLISRRLGMQKILELRPEAEEPTGGGAASP